MSKRQKELRFHEDFEVIKKVGSGNFTEIFKVEYTRGKKCYAIKVCNS